MRVARTERKVRGTLGDRGESPRLVRSSFGYVTEAERIAGAMLEERAPKRNGHDPKRADRFLRKFSWED